MLTNDCGTGTNLFRRTAIALLAAASLFSTSAIALAQSQPADSTLQSAIVAALGQDSALQGQQITATASNGVVTLTGTVQTDAQRQQAESDAANVSGVSGIMNNIKVTNPGSTASSSAGLAAQSSANQLAPPDQDQNQQDQDQDQQQAPDQSLGQNAVPPPPPDENQPQQPEYPQNYPQQQGYPQQNYPQQGYPQQNYPPQQRYPYQQGYAPQPQVPYYTTPREPVTIPAGTLIRVRLSEPLDTARLKNGTIFQATAATDIYENGILAIPRGANLTGNVVQSKEGGALGGSAILRLQLTNINLAGTDFPVSTDVWSSRGPNKAGYTASNTAGGAVVGAIIGGIIGRGAGAAIGAGVGAAGGLAASSATNGPRIYLPAEAAVDFHLANPATVQPVSWQEAQRLASSAPSQPVLMRRPRPIYVVPGPYYGPYGYAYPYPY